MRTRRLLVCALSAVLTAAPAAGHHSFTAEFDGERTITLSGTVTRIEWMNPHAHLYLDAPDGTGAVANWSIEMGSPGGLTRLGWTRALLEAGSRITVDGYPARYIPRLVNARWITIAATGQRLGAGSGER